MADPKSDFMAAEEIKMLLTGRPKDEQERIMRWVNESLSLTTASGGVSPVTGSVPIPHAHVPAGPPAAPAVHAADHKRPKDIRSFVTEKGPKKDVQFAAVVAYYYRFEATAADKKETLTAEDLDNAGRLARGYGFKNPRTTLNNACMLGYFDRAAKGEFRLNAVGENLVAMALPSIPGQNQVNGRGRRKVKRPSKTNKAPVSAAKVPVKRSGMSAEGKARIAAAQKARWAKQKAATPSPA